MPRHERVRLARVQKILILEKELGMSESEASRENWRGSDQGTQLKTGGDSGFEALLGGYRSHNGNSYDEANDDF